MKRRTHLLTKQDTTACGLTHEVTRTSVPSRVDCHSCKRSLAMVDAEIAVANTPRRARARH